MNKTVKKILIGLGVLLVIVLIIVGGFLYKFSSETAKMTPVDTGNVTGDVIALKDGFVNMYLIKNNAGYIAIDAGKDLDAIATELKKLNINPESVSAVFLTHSDMDHVAALPLFKNAKVYMSKEEEKMLTGEEQKIPGYSNSISRNDYITLNNQETVTTGGVKVFCILTDGHTSGSMCFQVNDKYLFTGDILSIHDGKLGDSVPFFDLDHDKTTQSISKTTNIPGVEYIMTSHWGVASDYKNAVKDWKD